MGLYLSLRKKIRQGLPFFREVGSQKAIAHRLSWLSKGLTLIELTLFLGLMTTVLVMLMRFEILGRQTTSLQMAQFQILSTISPSVEELVHRLRQAKQINLTSSACTAILKDGSLIEFFFDKETKILYEQKSLGNKKFPAQPLLYFLKRIHFQSTSYFLLSIKMEFSSGEYSLVLERKVALFQE